MGLLRDWQRLCPSRADPRGDLLADHRAASTVDAALSNPETESSVPGAAAFPLRQLRGLACVVTDNLTQGGVRKKCERGVVGGGATTAQVDPNTSLWVVLSSPRPESEPTPGCLCLDVVRDSLVSLSLGSSTTAVSLQRRNQPPSPALCISGCSLPCPFNNGGTPQSKTDAVFSGRAGRKTILSNTCFTNRKIYCAGSRLSVCGGWGIS